MIRKVYNFFCVLITIFPDKTPHYTSCFTAIHQVFLIMYLVSVVFRNFFGGVGSLFSLVSPRDAIMVGSEVKILKICLSGLADIGFLPCHLCHLFCYQVSCFCACLHYVQYCPPSQGTKNLVLEFLG